MICFFFLYIFRFCITASFFDAKEIFMDICKSHPNCTVTLLLLIEIMINCELKYDDVNYIHIFDDKCSVDNFHPYCVSPLFFTAFNNRVDWTILLIDQYFLKYFPTFIMNDCDVNGNTIFHYIINYNLEQEQIIDEMQSKFFSIIKDKIDASVFVINNNKGSSPVSIALEKGNSTVVRELITSRQQLDVNSILVQHFEYFMDSKNIDNSKVLTYLIMGHNNFNVNKAFVEIITTVKNINLVSTMLKLMLYFDKFAYIVRHNARNIDHFFTCNINGKDSTKDLDFDLLKMYHVSPLFFMLFNNRIDLVIKLIENYYMHNPHHNNYVNDKDMYGNTVFDYVLEKCPSITFRKFDSNLTDCQIYVQHDDMDAKEKNEFLHIQFGKNVKITEQNVTSLLRHKSRPLVKNIQGCDSLDLVRVDTSKCLTQLNLTYH